MTLFTPELGKFKAIAKGVRRTTSRLGGALEPLAELRVALARGRTFDVVTQVEVSHAWLHLRDSLESAATAWYLAELADRSIEERHEAEGLYGLLRHAYELLDAGMDAGRVARWYEMHLADELGVRPEVDRCVECDRMLEADEQFRWVPPLGGVLCSRLSGAARGENRPVGRGHSSSSRRISGWMSRPWPVCVSRRPLSVRWKVRCATSCAFPWNVTRAPWTSWTKCAGAERRQLGSGPTPSRARDRAPRPWCRRLP